MAKQDQDSGEKGYAGPLKRPPKAGDGTQRERRPEPEVNWYGTSDKPQEEYINEGMDRGLNEESQKGARNKVPDDPNKPVKGEP